MIRYNGKRYSSFSECRLKKHTSTMQGLATILLAEDVSFEAKMMFDYTRGFDDILISLKRSAAKNLLDYIYLKSKSNRYIYLILNNVARLIPKPLFYISKANCNMYIRSSKNIKYFRKGVYIDDNISKS